MTEHWKRRPWTSGPREWRAFCRVTLPVIAPAIAAAGLLALVVSFDDYVITSLVAGVDSETLPMVIYAMARRGVSPVVNAVSALIVVAFGSLILISQRLQKNEPAGISLAAAAAVSCARDPRPRLNVYNWSTYIDPAMFELLRAERGVRLRYGTYESNEEMLAKAMTGNSGWDVVFPTHSRLAPMARNGLLAHSIIAVCHRSATSTPDFRPGMGSRICAGACRTCGTPRGWFTTARRSAVPRMGRALEPGFERTRHHARRSGRRDRRVAAEAGLSVRFDRPGQLQAARAEAIAQKRLLRAYLNAEVRDQLVVGRCARCADLVDYRGAGHAAAARARLRVSGGRVIRFIATAPRSCGKARRYELAHEFLDFLLRPDVAAANARAADTATANGAARR